MARDAPSVASLLEAALPVLAEWLDAKALVRLLSCCSRLRSLEGVPLDLSGRICRSDWLLAFVGGRGARFELTSASIILDSGAAGEPGHFERVLRLPGLRELNVRRVAAPSAAVTSIEPLREAKSLTSLEMGRGCCPAITDLSPLEECHALASLSIEGAALTDITGISRCKPLTHLKLQSMKSLTDLAPLSAPGSYSPWRLVTLSLRGCAALHDIEPLSSLANLRSLSLALCTGLDPDRGVDPLADCAQLSELTLTGCNQLRDVAALSRCANLRVLYLTGCNSLGSVEALSRSPKLECLHLNKCAGLVDVSSLGHCSSLRLLNLRCSRATIVPHRQGLVVLFDTVSRSPISAALP